MKRVCGTERSMPPDFGPLPNDPPIDLYKKWPGAVEDAHTHTQLLRPLRLAFAHHLLAKELPVLLGLVVCLDAPQEVLVAPGLADVRDVHVDALPQLPVQ